VSSLARLLDKNGKGTGISAAHERSVDRADHVVHLRCSGQALDRVDEAGVGRRKHGVCLPVRLDALDLVAQEVGSPVSTI